MSTYAYQEILNQIRQLTPEEQLQLREDIDELVRSQAVAKPVRSVLELQGLGAEIWKGVDVEEYINRERDSWDG